MIDKWKKFINEYERSGLSKSQFCKSKKLKNHQFYYWCSKLRPDLNISQTPTSDKVFIPLKDEVKKSIKIELGGGTKLTFDHIPDPSWFAKLIKSMELSCD